MIVLELANSFIMIVNLETRMSKSFNKIRKFAEHLVILEFMKSRLEIFQNVISGEEVDYLVKSKSGEYYEITLNAINL
jgi:hypothetical protein